MPVLCLTLSFALPLDHTHHVCVCACVCTHSHTITIQHHISISGECAVCVYMLIIYSFFSLSRLLHHHLSIQLCFCLSYGGSVRIDNNNNARCVVNEKLQRKPVESVETFVRTHALAKPTDRPTSTVYSHTTTV